MESKNVKIFMLLEAIVKEERMSQRELSTRLNISLGLVNSFIKNLISKGMIVVVQLPKNRVKYALTSKGVLRKNELAKQYLTHSLSYYKEIKKRVLELLTAFANNGERKIVFYGAGEITEIACIAANEENLCDTVIIDELKAGRRICGVKISDESVLGGLDYDAVFIVDIENHNRCSRKLMDMGVPPEKIFSLFIEDSVGNSSNRSHDR